MADYAGDMYSATAPAPLRVFIGYDRQETGAFHVLAHSINRHATMPVSITGIALHQLERTMWRKRDPKQSTDFAFSRFLVPALCGYRGWALFMDCDMLARADIAGLFALSDHTYPVQVVRHFYTPSTQTKMLGMGEGGGACEQTRYEKKNWSSVMLFNCGHGACAKLTPGYVNTASGLDLHQFRWLEDESLIGEIPAAWNHLVGEYPYHPDAKIVHYTLGGPWLDRYHDCDYADEWRAAMEEVVGTRPASFARRAAS